MLVGFSRLELLALKFISRRTGNFRYPVLASDFPGYQESCQQNTPQQKVNILEQRFSEEIYEKRTAGSLIALEIGLEKLCEENHHFKQWIEKIKQLV